MDFQRTCVLANKKHVLFVYSLEEKEEISDMAVRAHTKFL